MNKLRDMIAKDVSDAIEGVAESANKEEGIEGYMQARNNYVQITTDTIIKHIIHFMPPAIDVKNKYETSEQDGIYVTVGTEHDMTYNSDQLTFLASFADDKGYNRYRTQLLEQLKSEYNPLKTRKKSV